MNDNDNEILLFDISIVKNICLMISGYNLEITKHTFLTNPTPKYKLTTQL